MDTKSHLTIYSDTDLRAFIFDCVTQAFQQNKNDRYDNLNKGKPLNVVQVCELTGYAESSIRTKVMNREIPFHKKSARVFFFEEEILSWIKEGRQKTKSQIEAEV